MLYHKEEKLAPLIDAFAAGDEAAFEAIIRLIASDVVNIAYYYLGNYEDAKDVSQDIFVKLYKKLPSFQGKAKFSTWLYRVAVNTCIDRIRASKQTVSLDESRTESESDTAEGLEYFEKEEMKLLVCRSVERLPLRQKNVVILKHFVGMTMQEISVILGCSESSVKTHLSRAIENLRKIIETEKQSYTGECGDRQEAR